MLDKEKINRKDVHCKYNCHNNKWHDVKNNTN